MSCKVRVKMTDPDQREKRRKRRQRSKIARELRAQKYHQRVVDPKVADYTDDYKNWSLEKWYKEYGSE
jgi:hypothetical protein